MRLGVEKNYLGQEDLSEGKVQESSTDVTFLVLEKEILVVKRLGETKESIENKVKSWLPEPKFEDFGLFESKPVDYETLFQYLSNSVKQNDFSAGSYMSYDKPVEIVANDIDHQKLNDFNIDKVVREAKLKNQYGIDNYVHPSVKAIFDMWKLCNNQENKLRYDLISL